MNRLEISTKSTNKRGILSGGRIRPIIYILTETERETEIQTERETKRKRKEEKETETEKENENEKGNEK
jgi:hypothetical protein